jgi:hypothetical protein
MEKENEIEEEDRKKRYVIIIKYYPRTEKSG